MASTIAVGLCRALFPSPGDDPAEMVGVDELDCAPRARDRALSLQLVQQPRHRFTAARADARGKLDMGRSRRDDDATAGAGARKAEKFGAKTLPHVEVGVFDRALAKHADHLRQGCEHAGADARMAIKCLAKNHRFHAGYDGVSDCDYPTHARLPVDR